VSCWSDHGQIGCVASVASELRVADGPFYTNSGFAMLRTGPPLLIECFFIRFTYEITPGSFSNILTMVSADKYPYFGYFL